MEAESMSRYASGAGRAGAASLAVCALVGFSSGACREASVAETVSGSSNGSPARALVFGCGPEGARDLFVVPVAGGEPRRLTRHPASDGLPRWSADGRSVVFASNRSGNWQLWRVSAQGGDPVRVRTNEHTEWQADESPDGRFLAFLSNRDGRESLWILEQATGEMRSLVRHGRRTIMGNPHWSPDGTRIVFSSNWKIGHQIHVVDVATGETTRVSPVGGCEPRFSPDGRRVAYVRRRPRGRKDVSHIVEHDLASGEETILVDWPALNYDPVYSPDGSEIAFASQITGEWEIYRQGLADGKARRVTFSGGDARYPDYRPVAGGR
jgi:Tol biopolymer transport system component